jgi:hypothetical protein
MTKKLKKYTAEKQNYNFQAKKEVFRPQKRTSSTSKKHEILSFFLILWVNLALLDPDTDPLTRLNMDPIRIRIRNTALKSFSPGLDCLGMSVYSSV